MIVWIAEDESGTSVLDMQVFANPHKAMNWIDGIADTVLSWYQINERWWRGYNAASAETYSVTSYEVN